MTTENSTTAEMSTIDQTTADLLVVASAIQPEQSEAVLTNLAEAFSVESVVVAAQNQLTANGPTNLRIVSTPQSAAG